MPGCEYDVKLDIATIEDKTVVRNLMQLYQHDLSEFNGQDFNAHGMFEYNYLDHYWTPGGRADGRVPFIVRVDDAVAGFVLKNRVSFLGDERTDHVIAEFFIARKWRRRGIGRIVAFALFDRFPGEWEVGEQRSNAVAIAFWRKTIDRYTGGRFEEVDARPPQWDGYVQRFIAGPR
ncbi:GNAT family N-acetyltransferase [Symbiobacterium terraclitae]